MRVAKTALGAAVLCGGLLFGGAAAFAQTPSGGAIQVWATATPNGGGSVLLTGAIADSGKSANVNSSGKPTKNGSYTLLELKKGTILLNSTQLDTAMNNANPTSFNTTTCSGSLAGTEPVPIVSGTKAYAGISGTVNVTLTIALILPLTNGKCDMSTNANPVAQYGSVTGSGTVSLG